MILHFSFKNYKSFRNETLFSFAADNIRECDEQVVHDGKLRILPAVLVFGANASGKSNFLDALRFMAHYVKDSFSYANTGNDRRFRSLESSTGRQFPRLFLLDEKSRHQPSTFEVTFTLDSDPSGVIYVYGFSLGRHGVVHEWLSYTSKYTMSTIPLFDRRYQKPVYTAVTAGDLELNIHVMENIEISLAPETLVLSLGKLLGEPLLMKIADWFKDIRFSGFEEPPENIWNSNRLPEDFAENPDVQAEVVQYIRLFDPSIIGFEIENILSGNPEAIDRYCIEAIHEAMEEGEPIIAIPLSEEGAGIRKMLALYKDLHHVLTTGGVLVVDDFDRNLHPLLVRDLMVSFLNPDFNLHQAQILLSTHDACILDWRFLRRDEIWLIDKIDQVSHLAMLCDIRDENLKRPGKMNLQVNYLQGKYGGIPNLEYLDFRAGEED